MNSISASGLQLGELLRQARTGEMDKPTAKEMKLREACNDFEAVLTTTLLKEGMKSAKELGSANDDEEKDAGSESYKDLAHEQIATFIGRQGMLGLGDMLYQATRHRINDTGDRK